MEYEPKTTIPPKDDPEFCAIKNGVDFLEFVKFMADKQIASTRLPLNNPEAFRYLCWLNARYIDGGDGCFINFLLNLWDNDFTNGGKKVRPPTAREYAIRSANEIMRLKNATDIDADMKDICIDAQAEMIRDAYAYWCYPIWIATGLAGCVMKWGTFEDNLKDGDEFATYEDWMK